MKNTRSISMLIILLIVMIQSVYGLPEIITTKVCQVAPGVIHKQLKAPSKPWIINVLEMNIQDTSLQLRVIDGGGLQKPSVMASAQEGPDYRLVGATNGDFFEPDYRTTNAGVVNGKITKLEKLTEGNPVYWSALSIDDNKMPTISCNKFEGHIYMNGQSLDIDDINEARGSDELMMYNHYRGSSTGTNGGAEIRIRPVNGWIVNDTMRCVMESMNTNGNMSLATATAVLSGSGSAATFLQNNYVNGDTVDIILMMKAFEDLSVSGVSYNFLPLVKPLKYLAGGFPMFVRNGQNYAIDGYRNENGGGSFATDLHPRTAVGYNADTTKFYMVVVDGRQSASIGISLIDLADIMIEIGAWRAMNFDGGGSTAMVVGNDVVNTPSDGTERSVRNCVAIYSTAAEEPFTKVQIELDTMKLYREQSFDFAVSGWDQNYNPKNVDDWGRVALTCDTEVGSISGSNGNYTLTATGTGKSGYVYAILDGDKTDSMLVEPIELDPIILLPANALTDTNRTISYFVKGVNIEGDTSKVSNEVFDFSVKNEEIGSITDEGVFTGIQSGSTVVYAHYGDLCDSTVVRVIIGEGECSLDRIESIDGWALSGVNLDSLNTHISIENRVDGANGSKTMRIDYKTTDNGKIYLSKNIEIPGVPDMIMMDVLTDGLNNRMYVNLEDASGKIFTVFQSGYINNVDNYETLYMDASGIDPVYPLRVKNIYIRLQTGLQEGTIYIDDLRMTYPGNTAIENTGNAITPDDYELYPSYPNPFNPSVCIPFELRKDADVNLSIYNIRGELIEMLISKYCSAGNYTVEWTPGILPSAPYFYKLEVGGESKVGKMLYLK